jgi:hypothetical protein
MRSNRRKHMRLRKSGRKKREEKQEGGAMGGGGWGKEREWKKGRVVES